jgi:hypothetical protein
MRPSSVLEGPSPGKAGTRSQRAPGRRFAQTNSKQVEDRERPRAVVIFETIRREGEEEYKRPSAAL